MLDQQNADKTDLTKLKSEQESWIDRTTHTSLESEHHRWGGHQNSSGNRERAIFRELLATVDYRRKLERDGKEAERQDAQRMTAEVEKQMAWQWHLRREEDKQEKERLSVLWTTAAKDKRQVVEAEKAAALQEEKEVIQHMNQGLIPNRRLRRPKEECIAAQDMLPPPHRLVALTPRRANGAWQ
jgi:hypothetical protein